MTEAEFNYELRKIYELNNAVDDDCFYQNSRYSRIDRNKKKQRQNKNFIAKGGNY